MTSFISLLQFCSLFLCTYFQYGIIEQYVPSIGLLFPLPNTRNEEKVFYKRTNAFKLHVVNYFFFGIMSEKSNKYVDCIFDRHSLRININKMQVWNDNGQINTITKYIIPHNTRRHSSVVEHSTADRKVSCSISGVPLLFLSIDEQGLVYTAPTRH